MREAVYRSMAIPRLMHFLEVSPEGVRLSAYE